MNEVLHVQPRSRRLTRRQHLLKATISLAERLTPLAASRPKPVQTAIWGEGLSVVIPEHANAVLLERCLTSVHVALALVDEPSEIVVSVNGSPLSDYDALKLRFPKVRWIYHPKAKGFLPAALRGVRAARYPAVYLLNNDMVLDVDSLQSLMPWRAPHIFAVASQIFFDDVNRRREETGLTAFLRARDGWPTSIHQMPNDSGGVVSNAYASGGATLFHRDHLKRFMRQSGAYNPFYWEDAEWGLRAWREGMEILFQPASKVWHRHRATVSRRYGSAEVDRIAKRNGMLFEMRNGAVGISAARVAHKAGGDLKTLAELAAPRQILGILCARWRAARTPLRGLKFDVRTDTRWFTPPRGDVRPTAVIVTPYVLLPARHGGAIRVTRLMEALRERWRIVIVGDEPRSWRQDEQGPFDELHLVENRGPDDGSKVGRMISHSHAALAIEVARLSMVRKPNVVQIEFTELAALVTSRLKTVPWILSAHDVTIGMEGSTPSSDKLERQLAEQFDAIVTCSEPDSLLLSPLPNTIVANGASVLRGPLAHSKGQTDILFVGPFRYQPNLNGARAFVKEAFPTVLRNFPNTRLVILGGDGGTAVANEDPLLSAHANLKVVDGVDDVRPYYEGAALTINPLISIRGSSLKIVEALAAGRVCISTLDGARGFEHLGGGLIIKDAIGAFGDEIVRLLADEPLRLRLERSNLNALGPFDWSASAQRLEGVWRSSAQSAV